ncbi:MAG: phosphomannomutase/phosphoglucomutase [Betaproteobacteria bacterium]|nr:phosphomannomutase/phosphoglucomutase [Betaproteobacteria bacterium]
MIPDPSIFKAYDIRGITNRTLSPDVVRAIGYQLGLMTLAAGKKAFLTGRDGRLSGPALSAALTEGLCKAGVDVIDIGQVTTPILYFATYELGTGSGAAVTGSHNPPEYNGLKMMVGGNTLYGESIQDLYRAICETHLSPGNRPRESLPAEASKSPRAPVNSISRGSVSQIDMRERYLARVVSDIKLARGMKIAIDCGNGVAGAFAQELFQRLGCEVVPLYCEVDGNFPNHHPDPADPHNLEDLMRVLNNTDCEIGLAFDGDGDRLGVVTKSGSIIWPDRQLMLFARDVLSRNPGGEIIYDVKCSRHVGKVIEAAGGKATMYKTGHSLIKVKLKETGAPLAGEMSGHVFFKERWYGFDDGLYAAARLLEILSREPAWLDERQGINGPSMLLESLPNSPSTPELKLECVEGENFRIVNALQESSFFEQATQVVTIDGVRAEYQDGFGLARASNTTPVVVIRFEADDDVALARIQAEFRRAFQAVKPGVVLPF